MIAHIDLACESDAKDIHKVINSVAKWLRSQHMHHWDYAYPFKKIRENVAREIVYSMKLDGSIIGTITIAQEKIFYYHDDEGWEKPNEQALYVSGLAILPEYMGRGCATSLLAFTEKMGRCKNVRYVRLDVVSHYKKLLRFYEKRGYAAVSSRVTGNFRSNFFEKCL